MGAMTIFAPRPLREPSPNFALTIIIARRFGAFLALGLWQGICPYKFAKNWKIEDFYAITSIRGKKNAVSDGIFMINFPVFFWPVKLKKKRRKKNLKTGSQGKRRILAAAWAICIFSIIWNYRHFRSYWPEIFDLWPKIMRIVIFSIQ